MLSLHEADRCNSVCNTQAIDKYFHTHENKERPVEEA